MSTPYQVFGWVVSPYTQKTVAYLKYKNISHHEEPPSLLTLTGKIKKHVGKIVMPTVITPDGQWLQDSTEIIDSLEKQFIEKSVIPSTPAQRIASHLFETHGDEWLIMPALYYRWSIPESARFAIDEFGRYGAPGLPGFLRRLLGLRLSKMMQAHLPRVGAVGDTQKGVDIFTQALIAQLDNHLQHHDYLLGQRPCLGDFALFGPLYAHLYRDTGSRYLFKEAPHVVAWIERLLKPVATAGGDFLPNDEVPETLTPILQTFFQEQFIYIQQVVDAVASYAQEHPGQKKIRRTLGTTPFTIGGIQGERTLYTFAQWKIQRALDCYQALSESEKTPVNAWLDSVGGSDFKSLTIKHRLIRKDFREVFE